MRVPHFGVVLHKSVMKYRCCILEKQYIFLVSLIVLQLIYILISKIFLTSYFNLDIWLAMHHNISFLLLPT
jgi:hypothetical protein